MTYPDALLKRIMLANNKDKGEEFVEKNYAESIKELTCHLIKEQLIKAQNIKIDDNDLMETAKEAARAQFSADGKYIAWQSMARDGYESDRNRLCVYELATGKKNYVSEKFDSSVEGFVWNKDNKSLSFIGVWHGTLNLYQANFKGEIKQITNEWADYGSISLANNGNKLLATKASMSHPTDIYIVTPGKDAKSTKVEQITRENDHILNQLNMGKCEQRWVKTTDGKQMLVWIMLPSNFDANKKYPTLLFCEGGPQSPVSILVFPVREPSLLGIGIHTLQVESTIVREECLETLVVMTGEIVY